MLPIRLVYLLLFTNGTIEPRPHKSIRLVTPKDAAPSVRVLEYLLLDAPQIRVFYCFSANSNIYCCFTNYSKHQGYVFCSTLLAYCIL